MKGILRQLYSAIIMLVVVEAIYHVLSFCIKFVPGASGTLWASTRKQIDVKGCGHIEKRNTVGFNWYWCTSGSVALQNKEQRWISSKSSHSSLFIKHVNVIMVPIC